MSLQGDQTVGQIATEVEAILKSTTAPWPSFSGGQQEAFSEFLRLLKQEFGLILWDELFKLNTAEVDAINLSQLKEIQLNPTSTYQYSKEDWNKMIAVVYTTLAYKDTIATAIGGQAVYLEGVQQIFSDLTNQTIGYVGLKQSDPPPQSAFPFGDLFDIFLSSFNLFGPPEGPLLRFLAGFIKGIIQFAKDLAKQGGTNAPSQEKVFNDFVLRSLAIERELTDQFAAGIASLTGVINAAVSDYGKLQALALFLNQPDIVWPQQAPPVDTTAEQGLEITLWKLFLPARWTIVPVTLGNTGPFPYGYYPDCATNELAVGIVKGFISAWPQSQWVLTGQSVVVLRPRNGPEIYAFEVEAWTLGDRLDDDTVNPHIASASAIRLFDVLGVARADVFGRTNGWSAFKVAQSVTLVKSAFPGGFDPMPVFGEPQGGIYPTRRII